MKWEFNAGEGRLAIALEDYDLAYSLKKEIPDFLYDGKRAAVKEIRVSGGTIEAVGRHCFSALPNLRRIVFAAKVRCIEPGAFFLLPRLREVVFEGAVLAILGGAFDGCPSLLPPTVDRRTMASSEALEDGAFSRRKGKMDPLFSKGEVRERFAFGRKSFKFAKRKGMKVLRPRGEDRNLPSKYLILPEGKDAFLDGESFACDCGYSFRKPLYVPKNFAFGGPLFDEDLSMDNLYLGPSRSSKGGRWQWLSAATASPMFHARLGLPGLTFGKAKSYYAEADFSSFPYDREVASLYWEKHRKLAPGGVSDNFLFLAAAFGSFAAYGPLLRAARPFFEDFLLARARALYAEIGFSAFKGLLSELDDSPFVKKLLASFLGKSNLNFAPLAVSSGLFSSVELLETFLPMAEAGSFHALYQYLGSCPPLDYVDLPFLLQSRLKALAKRGFDFRKLPWLKKAPFENLKKGREDPSFRAEQIAKAVSGFNAAGFLRTYLEAYYEKEPARFEEDFLSATGPGPRAVVSRLIALKSIPSLEAEGDKDIGLLLGLYRDALAAENPPASLVKAFDAFAKRHSDVPEVRKEGKKMASFLSDEAKAGIFSPEDWVKYIKRQLKGSDPSSLRAGIKSLVFVLVSLDDAAVEEGEGPLLDLCALAGKKLKARSLGIKWAEAFSPLASLPAGRRPFIDALFRNFAGSGDFKNGFFYNFLLAKGYLSDPARSKLDIAKAIFNEGHPERYVFYMVHLSIEAGKGDAGAREAHEWFAGELALAEKRKEHLEKMFQKDERTEVLLAAGSEYEKILAREEERRKAAEASRAKVSPEKGGKGAKKAPAVGPSPKEVSPEGPSAEEKKAESLRERKARASLFDELPSPFAGKAFKHVSSNAETLAWLMAQGKEYRWERNDFVRKLVYEEPLDLVSALPALERLGYYEMLGNIYLFGPQGIERDPVKAHSFFLNAYEAARSRFSIAKSEKIAATIRLIEGRLPELKRGSAVLEGDALADVRKALRDFSSEVSALLYRASGVSVAVDVRYRYEVRFPFEAPPYVPALVIGVFWDVGLFGRGNMGNWLELGRTHSREWDFGEVLEGRPVLKAALDSEEVYASLGLSDQMRVDRLRELRRAARDLDSFETGDRSRALIHDAASAAMREVFLCPMARNVVFFLDGKDGRMPIKSFKLNVWNNSFSNVKDRFLDEVWYRL